MEICPNFSGVLIGVKGHEALLVHPRCKSWSCEFCAKMNTAQWRAIIIDACNKIGGDWYFMTLTAHRNAMTRQASLINLQNGWKKLAERIRRVSVQKVEYVRVYELHKNGRVHMHFITNWEPFDYVEPVAKKHPGSRWLKDNAAQCGMGNQVKIQLIKGHAGLVAAYATKYISKDLSKLPEGIRRIQTSQGFKQKTEINPSDYDWTMYERFTRGDYNWMLGLEYEMFDVNTKRAPELIDFEDNVYKPD